MGVFSSEDQNALVSDASPLDPPEEGLVIVDDTLMDEYRPPGPGKFLKSFITKKRTCIIISVAILCVFLLLVVGSVVPSVVLTRPGRENSSSDSKTSKFSSYSPNSPASASLA